MSWEKGYLRTLSCSINLSSCRVRAESLARALNNRFWPLPGFGPQTSQHVRMAEVVEKQPGPTDVYRSSEGYEIGHCWVNDLPPEEEDSYNTPPCSSPPSPEDGQMVVNPITSLPFSAKWLKDCSKNCVNRAPDNYKLRDKLLEYADSLAALDDNADTFYDAKERTPEPDCQESKPKTDINEIEDNKGLQVSDKTTDEYAIGKPNIEISLVVHPPETLPCEASKKHYLVNKRLCEVQDNESDDKPELLRSTSLKTGKTPPGTPSRKKIVRFADVLGLDLEDIRHIVSDDLPHVPSSAFKGLVISEDRRNATPQTTSTIKWSPSNTLSRSNVCPLFRAPGSDLDFLERVRKDWVCLESVTTSVLSAQCVCRVLNASYEKHVVARYTTDDWLSWEEVLASYLSSDGEFDRFTFNLYMKPGTRRNQILSFAIRYVCGTSSKWDNNRGQNYSFKYTGSENNTNLLLVNNQAEDSWSHHFF